MRVEVRYFASLRDRAGTAVEVWNTEARDLAALYDEVQARHGFALPRDRLRASLDGAFARWDAPLHEGADVAFLPPVSGG